MQYAKGLECVLIAHHHHHHHHLLLVTELRGIEKRLQFMVISFFCSYYHKGLDGYYLESRSPPRFLRLTYY